MERAMRNDHDFDHRTLTPEQWAELTRHVMREAHAARAQSLRTFYRAVFGLARAAVGPVRHLADAARARRATYDIWLERRRAVRDLCALDDRSLKDMGLHRSEIESVVFGGSPAPSIPRSVPVAVRAPSAQGKRGSSVAREAKQLVSCSAAA
jgi:uncharacterized protein YjiS (DUF1127 family)